MYGNISKAMLRFVRKKAWEKRSDEVEEKRKEDEEAIKNINSLYQMGIPLYSELEFCLKKYLKEVPYVKEKNFPIWKPHFPDQDQLQSKFQRSKTNYAILIGNSQYSSKGDKKFADLKQAKNDVRGIRTFLLQSLVEFKDENIEVLTDSSIEKVREAMDMFKKKAEESGEKGETNIFIYYSGHGQSLEGRL